VLGLPPSPGPAPSFECPQPVQSQSLLQPVSPLPAPSPYTGPTGGLAERRAPASRPASPARPACTSRRTSRPRPPAVPGTHQMALRPSTAPLRVPFPSPPASSLPAFPDPEPDSLRAASPTVARFLATVVTDPSLASTAASALVADLVDFAASCRLDYAASLVAESASVCPPSVGGECALSTDVLEDRCFPQSEAQSFPLCGDVVIHPELDWSCDLLFSPTLPMGVFLRVPNILLVHSFLFLHSCLIAELIEKMTASIEETSDNQARCVALQQVCAFGCVRAAQQPSRPTAESPSSRAAEPPCRRAATVPTDAPRPCLLGLCDRADRLSLFDLTSGASPAPPTTADSTVRSQWATHDAAARLAVRRHLPTTERAHFSQYKSAQTLYDAVVARYSSPATAALSRLMLPYLFPELAAFPTVADLITHLHTSDTRYHAALPAEFCAKNPPPHVHHPLLHSHPAP
ncbi:unnamed protein product, partial [Closterium sp. NIES-54]